MKVNISGYQCDECKSFFNWDKNSRWYGSYAQLEHKSKKVRDSIPHFCSEKCGDKYLNSLNQEQK